MLGFLAPLWLAGFASLAVPLVLHFWSRRTGRALRVGSIRLLTGAPPPMARRPRLHDPWLLLLRCAILGALVLALARPYWMPRQRAAPIWALVATDVVDRARLVDSLERRGQTVSALDPNDLWLGLAIADRAAPPDARFEVYATPLLSGARGTRPVLRSAVTWHPRPATRETGTATSTSPARIVTVFADPSRTDDARYVVAAVRAVGSVSGISAIVSTRASAAADAASVGSSDWIVWLSNQPLADVVQQRLRAGATVLTDVGSMPSSATATRVTFEPLASRTSGVRRSLERALGAPVWTDVAGAPLLTVAREGRGLRYRFQSRFAPSWSDLVLDPGFPEAIARLWIGADSTRLQRDDRPIALSQVLPAYEPQPSAREAATGARSLFLPVWLIALGLFLAERCIASRSAAR
jgi:hypothetical protein